MAELETKKNVDLWKVDTQDLSLDVEMPQKFSTDLDNSLENNPQQTEVPKESINSLEEINLSPSSELSKQILIDPTQELETELNTASQVKSIPSLSEISVMGADPSSGMISRAVDFLAKLIKKLQLMLIGALEGETEVKPTKVILSEEEDELSSESFSFGIQERKREKLANEQTPQFGGWRRFEDDDE